MFGGAMNLQKIVGLVAVLLAIVAAFAAVPYAALILAVLGLVMGFFIPADAHVRIYAGALVLKFLNGTFDTIPQAGSYVTAIIGNIGLIAAGAAIMIVFRNLYERLKP